MKNWISEKVTELMNTNTAAVLDSFYANGTGGSYRMIFEPKGFKVWLEDSYYFTREFDIVKFGWESRIGEESKYFESLYEVTSDTIAKVSEEIAKDWKATQDRFFPDE